MDFPKPSAYTPLSRLFSNEKERELEETRNLYAWVRARQTNFRETAVTIGAPVYEQIAHLSEEALHPLLYVMHDLTVDEEFLADLPVPDFGRMNLKEFVDFRNLLLAKQYFFTNQAALISLFQQGLSYVVCGVAGHLPKTESPSPFTIPLAYTLENPGLLIERISNTLVQDAYHDRGLFKGITDRLYRNLCKVSGREVGDTSSKPYKYAGESALPPDELTDQYLAGTTFHQLFTTPVPLKLTREDRFSHMHVVAGSGAGKTSLIEHLIIHDLQSDDPPTVILIDPHSDLIQRLIHADLRIEDRLIYINPRDTKHPPALNVFALNQDRLASYDEATREQVTASVIETFDYLFTGLFDLDLSGKQSVVFRNLARFMLSFPEAIGRNATILDMLALTEDRAISEEHMQAIRQLPPIQRDFFEKDFLPKNSTFKQTKEQIRYRLHAIIESPTMARLFTSPETKIDLFTEMNRGAVIVVDTAKDFLRSGSSSFGRVFISLILQAVQERAAIPEARRKETFLFIDEAAEYFDSNIDDLLTDARKYRCGLVLSHQYMDQASSSLRASLAANTSIKFASGLSAGDARSMAPEMRTSADFILGQKRLQFAAHIRNVTPHAVSIPIEPGALSRLPKLSQEAFDRMMERNRERVSLPLVAPVYEPQPERKPEQKHEPYRPGQHSAARPKPTTPVDPNEEISKDW